MDKDIAEVVARLTSAGCSVIEERGNKVKLKCPVDREIVLPNVRGLSIKMKEGTIEINK